MKEGGGGGEEEEEWDADFLDQLIHVEELALSASSSSNPNPNPTTNSTPSFLLHPPLLPTTSAPSYSYHHPPPLPPLHQPQQQNHHQVNSFISYSPPRELSQRPITHKKSNTATSNSTATALPLDPISSAPQPRIVDDDSKDREIHRLQRELERVSSQLTELFGSLFHMVLCVSHQSRNAQVSANDTANEVERARAVGVQTDGEGDFARLNFAHQLSDNLLPVWGCTTDQNSGRDLISKLFMVCSEDFRILFGRVAMPLSSKRPNYCMAAESSSSLVALQYGMHTSHASEDAKISHLYSVLTKLQISNGLLPLEDLFPPLLDLCHLQNAAILCNCLHILHEFLKHLLSLGRNLERRDNVIIEGISSGNEIVDGGLFRIRSSDPQEFLKSDIRLPLSSVNWVSLYGLMHQITVSSAEECVRLEAVSIMNMVLMRSNAYAESEKFGKISVFESIAQLLKEGPGLHVQSEALHLLFLLINRTKLFSKFCFSCKEEENSNATNDEKNNSTFNGVSAILEGLMDCITCRGNSIPHIELRKRAIIVLAFLASSGKSGFKVLVNHKLPKEANFLMLILQAVVSEMDTEEILHSEPAESIKARTSLIREALIVLNRIVSNPGYSATICKVLTTSRDVASLTIEIASRLSRKDQRLGHCDNITQKIRGSEIVELALGLKRRVFSFLGDNIL